MKKPLFMIIVYVIVLLLAQSIYAQEIFDAVRSGDLAKVKEFVEKDPTSVKLRDKDRETPLHIAALNDNEEIAKYLIEKGADLDAQNGSLYTPLMRAGFKVAKLLIEKGADINYESANGNFTALTVSISWARDKKVAEYLIDCGAKLPEIADRLFMFYLSRAMKKGSIKYLDKCLQTGFDPLRVSETQSTLLHSAAESNSTELIDKLVALGVQINKTNIYGWTPLHAATYNGNKDVVELLIKKGMDKNKRTIDGNSPYNLAVEAKKTDVINYLKSIDADQSPQKFPELTGDYMGQPKPGKKAVPFAAGIISTKMPFHSSVTISPDGKEAFWSADRTYNSKIINGKWAKPDTNNYIPSGDVPFISPDGEKLYFLAQEKGKPRYSEETISVMDKIPTGWSAPYPLPDIINSVPGIHFQVSVDRKRNLYFGARQNGTVVSRIYYSEIKNGTYSKPVIMENLKEVDANSPFIALDCSYLIITSNMELMILFRKKDRTWTKEKSISQVLGIHGRCPIVTPDGKYLFFMHLAGEKNIPYWIDASFIEDLRKEALKDDK